MDQRFTRRSPLPYSIHYFRCHPALWHDRLERVKALGLNAITASARIILCLACQRCLHGSAVNGHWFDFIAGGFNADYHVRALDLSLRLVA